jgi:hypothetical protein
MSLKKSIIGSIAGVIVMLSVSACYKDKTVILDEPEINRTINYASDIIPLFNKSCNTSGCHNSGGIKPDLSAEKAYSSLNDGGYINSRAPDQSQLYLWMTGKKGTPMPLSGPNKEYNALVLAWIKQGAKNN